VAAIGTQTKHRISAARDAFPELLEDEVYYCGYAAESSYGARSYLIVRPAGNILVDSPRFAGALADKIAALGGVRWMFLTHRDDVADHAQFRERFGCERILHAAHVSSSTRDVERKLDGDNPAALDEEVLFIPVPGHTRGSTCLLYRERFLFSGDHAWWDPRKKRIHASKSVCWYDWAKQSASMERLVDYRVAGARRALPAA
jgi:glyoxylase-like metal-dependent hydrolase (beta-lactamase superfamily II)